MTLTLYLVIQWGNAETPDVNSDDTYLLVRATSVQHAAEIADQALANLPTTLQQSNRLAVPSCNRIIELGSSFETDGEATVVIQPFISGPGRFNTAGYRGWMREEGLCDDWRDQREIFGE